MALTGRTVMAILIAGRANTCRSWSRAVADIRRSLVESLSSTGLLYRSYSEDGLDGNAPSNPKAFLAADPFVGAPLAREFPPSVRVTIGAGKTVYDRNVHPLKKGAGFELHRSPGRVSMTTLEQQPSRRGLNEKFCHESSRQGLVGGKEPRLGSGLGNDITDLQSFSEAIAIVQQGLCLDSHKVVEILKHCAKQKDLTGARQLHECILQNGMDRNSYVMNTLLNVYIRCGRLQDASGVFEAIEKKNDVTWRIMIAGYAEDKQIEAAMKVFNHMCQAGLQAHEVTCLALLKACNSPLALKWGEELHTYIRRIGFKTNLRLGTALVRMYAKCGCIPEARGVFEKLTGRDIVVWNVMIGAYAESGIGVEAYRLFLQMKQEGFLPDPITYMSILNQSASPGPLDWVKEIHGHAHRGGLDTHVRVGNALVHMYARCGSIDDARLVFDTMKKRDVTTWTTMIGSYAERGCGWEAYKLFLEMRQEGFVPNPITYISILNASASSGALAWVKEVHRDARREGWELDLRVGNALVHMYAKSGSIADARLIFVRMWKRDVVTWNTMIGSYAESGCVGEAYRLFLQMEREGFIPDAITYISILSASASGGELEWVKKVHRHASRAGLDSDVRVGNALVHVYGKNGSIADALLVFDRMKKKDVTTWNTMIGAYAKNGDGVEAYQLFLQMEREGFLPDAITYVSILNSSATAGALEWMEEVHRHARRAGLESDVRVGNALVHMYAKIGRNDLARMHFDRMEKRDVTTWTTMIGAYAESGRGLEAYQLFLKMNKEGFIPNAITYLSLLNAAASAGALEWVKEVHGHARRGELDLDLRVGNALVHMYAKSGSIDDARGVFEGMPKRDVITWNMMIGALAETGLFLEAYRLFLQMKLEGFIPDAITYLSILSGSASPEDLSLVQEVHGHACRAGLESDVRLSNALVHRYGKSNSVENARLVFDRMDERDVTTWNTMIGAYAEGGWGVEAYRIFLQMKREGFVPDAITFVSILNASGSGGALEWVREVHKDVLTAGLESDLRVGNALIHRYAKSGSLDDARVIFDRMEERDVVTWNIMIGGLAQHGCGHEAVELFKKMNGEGAKPNDVSFLAVLSACSHAGLLDDGYRVFSSMTEDFGIQPSVMHYTCMVDLLGRAGYLDEAKLFLEDMPVEPNCVTWKALLGACRTHGNTELGELAAKEVLKLEPKDSSAYVLLSNIYAAAGRWEKVASVRSMMEERGVTKEPGRSWIEVHNKIHEFGVGDKSHPEAKAIYCELSKLIEKLKAEGYVPDTQLVLRNIDEEDKELALCSHSEKLAIAYGLMHIPPEKPIHIYKNLRVCSDCHTATRFISKVTGREIIARDANRFHHFKDGECSCGNYW